jgi:hypothetical protein
MQKFGLWRNQRETSESILNCRQLALATLPPTKINADISR